MSKKLNKRGFTLIEVILVLAIGGLIFGMAFLAFRQASMNRRDTQRRSDANRIVTELQNYYNDHSNWPATSTNVGACVTNSNTFSVFIQEYLCEGGTSFTSPDGTNYTLVNPIFPSPGTVSTKNNISFLPGFSCGYVTSPGAVMLTMGLEKGTSVCKDIK